jgi:MacB-like periplasmic core domain
MWFPDRLRATIWRCRAIVWLASWLVPRANRAQWHSEQDRKFWHWCHFLAESGQLTPYNRLQIARHCWATFPDAFWQRFDRQQFPAKSRQFLGSPLTFLAGLALLITALVLASGIVPAARLAFSTPVPNPQKTVFITLDGSGINGNFSRTRSDTLLDLASIWSHSKLQDGLTPFSWGPGNLLLQRRDLAVATARVGPEFFATLDVKAALGRTFVPSDVQNCRECVLLSWPAWQDEFHADPHIIGEQISLNGAQRTVIGVLPANFRLISSGIAVWGLIDPAMLFTNFQRRVGAVARLHGDASAARLQSNLADLTESGGYVHPSSNLQVITVASQMRRNLWYAVWFVMLAVGCAVLVVILRHAANGFVDLPEGFRDRTVWLGFFAAKSVLLLTVAGLAAWSAVHWIANWIAGSTYPTVDEYSIWLFLPLAIAALSWSVRDQQRRCRTCLQRLELPVEIGRPGSVLLNWAGTEMVCSEGHGVLYLADSPANSLDRDHWSKLDKSWESLFRDD